MLLSSEPSAFLSKAPAIISMKVVLPVVRREERGHWEAWLYPIKWTPRDAAAFLSQPAVIATPVLPEEANHLSATERTGLDVQREA
jgi:hypothetical protein